MAVELERNLVSITSIFYKADTKETTHRIGGLVKDKRIEQINTFRIIRVIFLLLDKEGTNMKGEKG